MQVTYVKNYVLAPKNIAKNIYVEKTSYIRKVRGGGSGRAPKKKKEKRVLVPFPSSATPLVPYYIIHRFNAFSEPISYVFIHCIISYDTVISTL